MGDWYQDRVQWNKEGRCAREACKSSMGDSPFYNTSTNLLYCRRTAAELNRMNADTGLLCISLAAKDLLAQGTCPTCGCEIVRPEAAEAHVPGDSGLGCADYRLNAESGLTEAFISAIFTAIQTSKNGHRTWAFYQDLINALRDEGFQTRSVDTLWPLYRKLKGYLGADRLSPRLFVTNLLYPGCLAAGITFHPVDS